MKFSTIEVENFGRIKHAKVALSERGLVLIQGENLDGSGANSNGAGKSTLVEAISWALYGKTAKGVAGDAVINREIGKGCKVTIECGDRDGFYSIKRHRKHKTGKNRLEVYVQDGKDATWCDLTKGTDKLTQDVVDRIIGCSHEVFAAAVYAGQEAVPDLPGMTDKQLKLLIEEASGITELEQAHELARKQALAKATEFDNAERRVEKADTGVEHARQRQEDAERSAKRWEGERGARLMDLEARARTKLEEAKHARAALEDMTPEHEIKEKLGRAYDSRATLDREAERETELERVLAKEDGQVSSLNGQIAVIKRQLAKAKAYVDEVEDQVGLPCEACGRDHDKTSLESAITYAKSKVDEIKGDARTLLKQLEDAQRRAVSARESLEKYRAGMTDPAHLTGAIAKLETQLAERDRQKKQAVNAKGEAEDAVKTFKAEKARENPYLEEVATRKSELAEAVAYRKAKKDEAEALRRSVRIAKGVTEVFSPKGVRARILDTITPYINERTAHYLGMLSDGRLMATWSTITMTASGEPREKFSIAASDIEDGGSFADLSGGEKRRVRLACALALQDLVATRAAKPIDLWVGDEIDAALDTAGLERLMTVLEEKAKERGSIFVISHSDLRDWISSTITVRRKDGIAEVIE